MVLLTTTLVSYPLDYGIFVHFPNGIMLMLCIFFPNIFPMCHREHRMTILTGFRLDPNSTTMSVSQKTLDGAYNKLKATATLHVI